MLLRFIYLVLVPHTWLQSRNLEAIAWFYLGFICGVLFIPVLSIYGLYWAGHQLLQALAWCLIMAIFTIAKPSWAWATVQTTFRRNQFVSTF